MLRLSVLKERRLLSASNILSRKHRATSAHPSKDYTRAANRARRARIAQARMRSPANPPACVACSLESAVRIGYSTSSSQLEIYATINTTSRIPTCTVRVLVLLHFYTVLVGLYPGRILDLRYCVRYDSNGSASCLWHQDQRRTARRRAGARARRCMSSAATGAGVPRRASRSSRGHCGLAASGCHSGDEHRDKLLAAACHRFLRHRACGPRVRRP